MGIQAQIDRIKNNVTRSLAKVAEKGVTVPADANSDDLEGLIDAITGGGGGLPLGVSAIDYGTLTPTTDITSTTYIMHKLGVKPNFLCLIATGDFPFKKRIGEILLYTAWQKKVTDSSGSERNLSIQYTKSYASGNPNAQYLTMIGNVGSATRAYIECFANSKLAAGITYLWLAGVIDELE